ncbi:hypothetical protein J6590_084122 [Homalodisca vitripennis]|nr:hypothetical protein J6590_084122 [Homalodisca vitripennis]
MPRISDTGEPSYFKLMLSTRVHVREGHIWLDDMLQPSERDAVKCSSHNSEWNVSPRLQGNVYTECFTQRDCSYVIYSDTALAHTDIRMNVAYTLDYEVCKKVRVLKVNNNEHVNYKEGRLGCSDRAAFLKLFPVLGHVTPPGLVLVKIFG